MPVGLTKDAGWQIGVSRTLDHPLDQVWTLLTERPELWLGAGAHLPDELGQGWTAADGSAGELRGRRMHDRIRLTMRAASQPHYETTVQFTVRPIVGAGGETRTAVRFHQERLRGAEEREARREHWLEVLDRVAEELSR